ncbi:MAG: cytochrome c biogenesis protein ResB [Phycisphaerales bacterium]
MLKDVFTSLASLRLTVVLLAMSMVLILAGTLAQVNEGVWSVVARYFRSPFVMIPFQLFLPEKVARVPGVLPFPGGLTLGVALFINLVAAHFTRFKVTWKRTGIIISHLGILMLLVGEFVTGAMATEGNMTIDEGAASNYIEDSRTAELAVVDPSPGGDDLVVVVPQRLMVRSSRSGQPVTHGLLPFDVRVEEWMPNSRILGPMQSTEAQRKKADSGAGVQIAAVPAEIATGVNGAEVDAPSAYVTFSRAGQKLGTYLVSLYLDQGQAVTVDGKQYMVELRFKRTYKPYTIRLVDFRHDKFVGTDKPRNFSSQVRLLDPAHNTDREVLIYMNSPLRYSGDTLYQAAFKQGDSGTILQVVTNPGWLIPYISCAMVTVGLLVHFGIRLSGSIRRKAA